ncbi:uncharacterized protein LOC134724982 [Mytilus trossulus]|uniref:uncharacterized protein LOC134724982 n=1 Tax=Mytilus trossulus TaxID=6551 RepID=UPI003005DD59
MFNLICGFLFLMCSHKMIYAAQHLGYISEYNCSIETVDSGVRDKMKLLLEDGKKVTFIRLIFTNQINPFSDTYRGDLYRPMDWVRIAGRHGRSLLFLRPEFEQLSLTTLSLETGYMEVSLVQKPENCLLHFNSTIAENNLRDLLLSDFKPGKDGGSLSEHEYICNMHIGKDNSNAKFFYRCCHKDPDGNIVCEKLIYDFWINVVFICVIIINVFAIMFSPYLIPDSFYRKKYGRSMYEHKLMKPLQITVMKTDIPPPKDTVQSVVSIGKLKIMPSLYRNVQNIPHNEIQTLSLWKMNIDVQYRRLIPANYVPVGIMKTFYTMFVKCHIRKISKFGRCCKASIFGHLTNEKEKDNNNKRGSNESMGELNTVNSRHSWFRCLKQFMRILILIGISVPWIIRIIFFYWYEKPHTLEMEKAAIIRNMTLSFQWNLTNSLTPIHVLFLLCYFIIVLDAMVFGIVSHKVKLKLQLVMRKCLRDMREMSCFKALEWSALVLLVPFEKCGIFGFLIFGIYVVFVLPVVFGVLAFYCLPTVNLVLRLFVHFVAYLMPYGKQCISRSFCLQFKNILKECRDTFHLDVLSSKETVERPETISMKNRFLQLFVLIACFLTVISFILLTMEMVLFITEIFIYTIIGIIMNASAMLKYISLIFMLVLYARDCFKGISDKYLEFNKLINRLIVNKMREKVEKIASSDDQKNTAFQVQMDDSEEIEKDTENVKLIVKDGIPKWQIRRLILFLDVNDKPYLPEKFFNASCYMNTVGVPGPLIFNVVQATWRFLCICVFLMFVVLIVLAFGDEYQISGTNQMLATLAGGFLPWVFRNVLFKSKDALGLDTENLSFKSNLRKEIENYVQNWDIADMEVQENYNQINDTNKNTQATENSDSETKNLLNKGTNIPTRFVASVNNDQTLSNDVDLLIYDNLVRVSNV